VRRLFRRVHPRGRGERVVLLAAGALYTGSSPRARGTRPLGPAHPAPLRFIPAGAGNAQAEARSIRPVPVHPRGRGERWRTPSGQTISTGSSPRARGTLAYGAHSAPVARFIPAGAGNASLFDMQRDLVAVHPRGRGERYLQCVVHCSISGSSPRARGTLANQRLVAVCARFIPAGAGNARWPAPIWSGSTVHPRGRGERGMMLFGIKGAGGSSPRARGTRIWSCRDG